MATYKNIEEYRRRKKIKEYATKLLLIGLILLILFVLLNVLQIFKGSKIEEILSTEQAASTPVFPLTIKNEQLMDIYSIGNDFSVLTKASLMSYSLNGTKNSTVIHGYTNPVVKEGYKRLLTYDRGGTKLRVDSVAGAVGELTTENSILCAEIAQNGNVAVVMNYKNHAPVLVVYDQNLKQIFRYSVAADFTAAAFSSDGTHLALCSIITIGGILSAEIHEMDITKKQDAEVTVVPDIIPLALSYQSNGNLIVVGKDNLACIPAAAGGTPTYFAYKGDLQRFAATSQDSTVLVERDLFNGTYTIHVVGADGKGKASYHIEDEVADLYCDGSRVIVLGKKHLYNFDMNLSLLNDPIELEKTYNKVIYSGELAFVMGVDSVERYKIN